MGQKHRISLTLDEELVKKIDQSVDGFIIKNRSDAIEKIIANYLEKQKVKQAIILCGGKGIGNRPLTLDMPEAMLPIKEKPILEHLITHLKNEGIEEIILAVGYKHEKIISYFGNGLKFGINIKYLIEKEPLGTAGAILQAKGMIDSTFLVLNGDVVGKIPVEDMLKTHRQTKAKTTIALTTTDNPEEYGVVQLRGTTITGFVEKPDKEKAMTNLINAGVYLAEPNIFETIQKNSKKGKLMLEELFDILSKEELLSGYVYDGSWFDVSTKEKYERAKKSAHI
ncbi:MAG: NTP transferase domain-containing protein [Candidatus Aenigmarchaeota archaeon]|nr:NTP transferase domain-containing protein [Candidatus Aenigmarchaeota archaeon]